MNREEVQLLGFEIVTFAGDVRSKFLKALTTVQAGDFVRADALIGERNDCIAEARKAQTSLLAKEAQDDDIAYSVTVIHSQDRLMTTILLKDLMKHLLGFYKRG